MSETAPLRQTFHLPVEPVATAANGSTVIGAAPFDGTVEAVTYMPIADITGAATNNRKLAVINAGADGNGTTEIAEEQFVSGVDASQYVAVALTLSATASNRDVVAGDALVWTSAPIGTGIADPGGTVAITISRS